MKCEEVQVQMIEYLENTLDFTLQEKITEHLGTCERCRDEVKELRTVLQAMTEHEIQTPDESLRINFNSLLQSEMDKINADTSTETRTFKKALIVRWSSPLLRIAAGFVLFIAGVLIGMNLKLKVNDNQSVQFRELKQEVKEMKELVMFTMLREESPSQRIQAVNYAEEIQEPNQKVILALINTLYHDKNVNVRLAAAYSLVKFSDNQLVTDSFIEALGKETEPILQIVLINILTEKKEVKAVKPIQKIISDPATIKEVKDIAEKGIKVLI